MSQDLDSPGLGHSHSINISFRCFSLRNSGSFLQSPHLREPVLTHQRDPVVSGSRSTCSHQLEGIVTVQNEYIGQEIISKCLLWDVSENGTVKTSVQALIHKSSSGLFWMVKVCQN